MAVPVADPCLELARGLRAAIRRRDEQLGRALAAYDAATSETERWKAAAALMLAICALDETYEEAKREAVRAFGRRQESEAQ